MDFEFTPRFEKRLDALRDDILRKRLRDVVRKVADASVLSDIPNLKKMEGYPSAYRIRIGDYRIGLFFEDGRILFADFDHRGNIYSHFP